jgi:hypothetical protein
VSRGRGRLTGEGADHMIATVGHQCILKWPIGRDTHASWMAEQCGTNVNVARIVNIAARATDRGCGEDDAADQMVVSVGNQGY